MAIEYSVEVCGKLEEKFRNAGLYRPMRVTRYDNGAELSYDVRSVAGENRGRIRLAVLKFVGGGFAGQVYKVKILAIDAQDGPIDGLVVGEIYAMKILIPPSGFSRIFRNILYWIGFQGPFQLQVNPDAARAGALWQKFIRRGAKIRFGDSKTVVDIYALFVDSTLGSCGELSEWIEGRTWRLEVDDHLDLLKYWRKGRAVNEKQLGSPEYRAKYGFMKEFVELLHEMGGHEFARQYEWSTCKSQPNCLKRKGSEDDPGEGLVAIDFRAGLALLPFLPMSPGDIKLIIKGFLRGSLVQFDRGSISRLEQYVDMHRDDFEDMLKMLDDLKASEFVYRNSVPDITHNHIRLFYSRQLWSIIRDSTLTGWRVRNLIDDKWKEKLSQNRILTLFFFWIGFVPFLGRIVRRMLARKDWRKHYIGILTSRGYLKQALWARIAEKVMSWHRKGRINETRALKTAGSIGRFLYHAPWSILPAGLHRIITDPQYAKERLVYLLVRPVRLYFNKELREEWLREMVSEGRKKHILADEDAGIILSQIKEPFIQKYLKSLAVHVCTLPVTQVVSVIVALIYIAMHPEMPRAQAWGIGLGIIALFQVIPISPGSLVRGFYVLYLVVRERNFKDYNIAVFLGFFKYIGYLAFPIQMTYRFPVLARFMAGYWASESVHVVPVFGESGALLEHWVFRLFYNWPLTIRRSIRERLEKRASMKSRYWHIGLCTVAATGIWGIADMSYIYHNGMLPGLKEVWWLSLFVPFGCGVVVTMGCGGATLWKRFVGSVVCGVLVGILYTILSAVLGYNAGIPASEITSDLLWRIFIFSIFTLVGAITAELRLSDPVTP